MRNTEVYQHGFTVLVYYDIFRLDVKMEYFLAVHRFKGKTQRTDNLI